MNGSTKIQVSHRQRQAVVYVRQSDPKQVLNNRASGFNQRALKERLLELGWKKDRIAIIDEDQGCSGKHASTRDGFQKLVADVGLRKVGIIMGYEVSRLSRNCADWHRLLELCALFDTLIADADGIFTTPETSMIGSCWASKAPSHKAQTITYHAFRPLAVDRPQPRVRATYATDS